MNWCVSTVIRVMLILSILDFSLLGTWSGVDVALLLGEMPERLARLPARLRLATAAIERSTDHA